MMPDPIETRDQRRRRQFAELGLDWPAELTEPGSTWPSTAAPAAPGQATPGFVPVEPGWANPNRGESTEQRRIRQFTELGLDWPV